MESFFFVPGMKFGIHVALLLVLLFQVKHLVVDFFVQNRFPYMWMNKHKFLHPGGWLHAGSHAVASFGIFFLMHPPFPWVEVAVYLCAAELFSHFGIDRLKMHIGRRTGWKCNTSPYFWDLLGVDQFLHQIVYLGMIYTWLIY